MDSIRANNFLVNSLMLPGMYVPSTYTFDDFPFMDLSLFNASATTTTATATATSSSTTNANAEANAQIALNEYTPCIRNTSHIIKMRSNVIYPLRLLYIPIDMNVIGLSDIANAPGTHVSAVLQIAPDNHAYLFIIHFHDNACDAAQVGEYRHRHRHRHRHMYRYRYICR